MKNQKQVLLTVLALSFTLTSAAFAEEKDVGEIAAGGLTGVGAADFTYHKGEYKKLSAEYHAYNDKYFSEIKKLELAKTAKINELVPDLIRENEALHKKYGALWYPEPGDTGYSEAIDWQKRYEIAIKNQPELLAIDKQANELANKYFHGKSPFGKNGAMMTNHERAIYTGGAEANKFRGAAAVGLGVGAYLYLTSTDESVQSPAAIQAPAAAAEPETANGTLGE